MTETPEDGTGRNVIATTIGKDWIVQTPRMEVVREPWFIIDKRV